MFNRPIPFYSASALETVIVKRKGASDVLQLIYTSADPGITQQTIIILIDELKKHMKFSVLKRQMMLSLILKNKSV